MHTHDLENAGRLPCPLQRVYVAQPACMANHVWHRVSNACLAHGFDQLDRVPSVNRCALRRRQPNNPQQDHKKLVPGTLVWLRHFDLRLHDHPALSHAAQRGRPVHVVFAWSPAEDAAQGEWRLAGTAFALWLHHALASFDNSLRRRYGLSVTVRTGESMAAVLTAAVQDAAVDTVVTSCAFEPWARVSEEHVRRAVEAQGIKFRSFNSFLLQDVNEIRVDMSRFKGHFGTLTPFHNAHMAFSPIPMPAPEPGFLEVPQNTLTGESLQALGFAQMPLRGDGTIMDWGAPILEAWDISEDAALATLRCFLAPSAGLSLYDKHRNLADASAVTRISPYLRSGMLSPRLMFEEMKAAHAKEHSIVYWRRLIWRDLAYWQLRLFPKMQNLPIRAHYAGQTWNQDQRGLERWKKGMTGFPLVDAGMRQLLATGWMSQNVRMAAAILLCEYLNINWVEGEHWFHHTLVDADLAINAMMWQNAGQGGLDQWNFRMSPASSGKTQDPTGSYVRRWCPELAKLPLKYLHTPWKAPEHALLEAGVNLGGSGPGSYPERIVTDMTAATEASQDAVKQQRLRTAEWSNSDGYDLIVLPQGSTIAHDGKKFRVFTKPRYRNIDGHREQPEATSAGTGGGAKRFHKAAPVHSDFWTRKVESENREVLSEDAYSGIIKRYNRKQGWGLVLPDNPDELPQQVLQKLNKANKQAEDAGKQASDEHLLYFRKPDVNHADGFKLKSKVPVTFNVYIDNKGAGACDVTKGQT